MIKKTRKKNTKKTATKNKPVSKKTAIKNKPEKISDSRYEKRWIVEQLLSVVETESGIAKINALKELAKMRESEPPPVDEDLEVAFVPLYFADKKFFADRKQGVKIK